MVGSKFTLAIGDDAVRATATALRTLAIADLSPLKLLRSLIIAGGPG